MKGLMEVLDDLSCGEDDRAEAALPHLAAWGPQVFEVLQHRLNSPDPDTRWWAVRGLAEVQDERVPHLLVKALADPDMGVRWCAGLALRSHPSENSIPALVSLLAQPEALTRRLAGDALVAIGKPAVIELINVLQAGQQLARLEAIRALAKIGHESAIPALFAALDDSSALIEYWANEGLEKMGVGMVFYNPK